MTATAASPYRFSAPPAAISRFVGRDSELESVASLIGLHRLVTLTGAGGSGKTRLAVEALHLASSKWDVIVWVDLAALQDQKGFNNHVAAGFGLSERSDQAAVDGIKVAIGSAATLLVLDNCEHVIDVSARLVDDLLRSVPSLSIMATSREVLGVQGETAWLVPSLVPAEAQELFTERARAVLPTFSITAINADAVAEICRRLDGIPLAIELAAARVKVITVDQIVSRLSDALKLLSGGGRTALPRQRTLRATIEWSHALLTEREQTLLRRLSYFPSSFTLEAAESVGGGSGLDAGDVLDAMTGLVDKSLVMLDANETDARYRLLETMRQFGAEQLDAHGEREAVARRHAEHFLAVAELTAPHIEAGASDPKWMLSLVPEIANCRSAVEWASAEPDRYEIGLRLVAGLDWFWWARGPFEEVRFLERALQPEFAVAREVRLRGMNAFGHLHTWQGRPTETLAVCTAALELLGDSRNDVLLCDLHTQRGAAKLFLGDLEGCTADVDAAIGFAEQLPPHILMGVAKHFRGVERMVRGDLEGAKAAHVEEVEIAKALGHLSGMTHGLTGVANMCYLQGRAAEALALYRESLAIAARAFDGWGIVKGLDGVAICVRDSDPGLAVRLLAAAEAYRERNANPMLPDERARVEPVVAQLRELLAGDFETQRHAGRSISYFAAIDQALSTELSEVRVAVEHVARAAPSTQPTASGVDLIVRALGGLEVFRRGQPIAPDAWGSSRPRELFALLLCHPAGVTKEHVGLAFWPDATPTQLRNNFHVTLHRLRKALEESEWVVSSGDKYMFAPNVTVEFDARQFEAEVPREMGLLARGDTAAGERLAIALARYRGPFLEGEAAADWAFEWRDRLSRLFARGTVALGDWYLSQRRDGDAIASARVVLAQDPLNETAWRMLMTGLARTGQRNEALTAFRQCEAILASDLEVDPDEETLELRDRIQSGAL